jgi:hypothetical protein
MNSVTVLPAPNQASATNYIKVFSDENVNPDYPIWVKIVDLRLISLYLRQFTLQLRGNSLTCHVAAIKYQQVGEYAN